VKGGQGGPRHSRSSFAARLELHKVRRDTIPYLTAREFLALWVRYFSPLVAVPGGSSGSRGLTGSAGGAQYASSSTRSKPSLAEL